MGNLIRRNKAVPVEARRVEPTPDVINIPGAAPISAPPPASPGVTQNIIYVSVPAGQPTAAPPPPPANPAPQEVHYHNTNIYQAPRRMRRSLGTSFLGTMGFVLSGVAAGAVYLPQVMWLAKPIAIVAALLAGIGLLSASLWGRVGKGMPLLGLLASGVAYCLWLIQSGQLPGKYDQLRSQSPVALPAHIFDNNPASPSAPGTVAPPQTVAPAPDPTRLHDRSIFGDGGGAWDKSAAAAPAAAPAGVDQSTAKANLEQARITAGQKMGLDYVAVESAAADAEAKYQQAKTTEPLGSSDLIALDRLRLDAKSRLAEIQQNLRTDPAVSAAEQAVR